jgi:Pyruvate/2-oxoacid:ferredoxin oxidoreductase delta subunit
MQARLLTAATILAVAATSAGAVGSKTPAKKAPPATNSCAACTERGVVLDPALFADTRIYEREAQPAYEIARKYPATLDLLHCFCECQESMIHRHKTLLTCFTSKHAAGCGVCMNEAILAGQLKDKGLSDDQIENTVESVFKTDGHRPTVGPG